MDEKVTNIDFLIAEVETEIDNCLSADLPIDHLQRKLNELKKKRDEQLNHGA